MGGFLRMTLLALFGAGGASLAVCLAVSAPPPAAAGTAAGRQATDVTPAPPFAPPLVSFAAVEPATLTLPSAAAVPQPIIMPLHPPIAQQVQDDREKTLQFLEQIQNQFQQALDTRKAVERAPPPEEIAPPAVAPPVTVPEVPALPIEPASKKSITRPAGEGDDQLSIQIQNTDIREVLELISQQGGMNILPSPRVQGKVSASLHGVDIDTAMKAILKSTGFVARREGSFIYVGTPEDFKFADQANDRIATRVYRPNYVRAADLQQLITPVLTQGVGTVSITVAAETGIGADSNQVGGNAYAGDEAVVVRDYEAVLVEIDHVVRQVDRKPMQVAIEAMILSVALEDENQFGVDFQFLRHKNHVRMASGTPLADLGQVDFTDGGMKFAFLDSSLGAFFSALEIIGNTTVIATPKLMCLNKHRAEILIGEQLGYISTTVTETSTAQNVEFLEVGTQLRLRPFITPDGMIRMEVHPELSTGSVELRGDFTLPEKQVTQVTTNIMVPDGCTMIIGGLMREDLENSATQLPLLGNLPGVGFLFRQKNDTIRRSEILVLLTPHIIFEDQACFEAEQAICEFEDRHNSVGAQMSPLGRRNMARRYLRVAQEAFKCCQYDEAVRAINLAVQFDPTNREILDLQRRILGKVPCDGERCHVPVILHDSPEHPIDGEQVAPWVLDELTAAPKKATATK